MPVKMDVTTLMVCVALLFSTTAALKTPTAGSDLGTVSLPEYLGITTILLFVVGAAMGSIWQSGLSRDKERIKLLQTPSSDEQRNTQEAGEQGVAAMEDWKCFACACTLGCLNNNAYSTVVGASQDLAKHFGMQDYMAMFSSFILAACLVATFVNSAVCLKINIQIRMLVNIFFMTGGYLMLAIASGMTGSIGFMTACLASCLVGCSQTLGELANLAFFRSLPAGILAAWGAGTGLAGISGGSVYVGLRNLNLTNQQVFVYMMPTAFIYYGCFSYLHYRAKQCGVFPPKFASADEKSAELSWENLKEVFKFTWPVLVNLVAVYTLEYIIYPGMVDRDTLCPISSGFLGTNAYALMWTMYNVGVTISRVSINWFKIGNLWIITGLQALNLALWFVEANTHAVLNAFGIFGYYILFAWMIWVGLMGGSCYSNCMHAYNTRQEIPDKYRELGINVGMAMVSIGILGGNNLTTLMQTTILSSATLYPNGCPTPRFP